MSNSESVRNVQLCIEFSAFPQLYVFAISLAVVARANGRPETPLPEAAPEAVSAIADSSLAKRGLPVHGHGLGWDSFRKEIPQIVAAPYHGFGSGFGLIGERLGGFYPQQKFPQIFTETLEVPVPVDRPYPVVQEIPVPEPFPVQVKVPVDRPYPVEIPIRVDHPYPVEVPVAVPQPQPYPVKVPVRIPEPYPVEIEVPVDHPYPVVVDRPVPVYEKVPVEVRVPVDRPYPVEVKVPVRVEVPVDRPYPVYVEKKVPEPYPVEVPVQVPVYIPVQVPVDRPYPFEVKVPVPEPYPVEVSVRNPLPYGVELTLPLEKSLPQALAVETALPARIPFGRIPFGKPVSEISLPISGSYPLSAIEDCIYPEPITSLLPGSFSGLLPYALKNALPISRHGFHGF